MLNVITFKKRCWVDITNKHNKMTIFYIYNVKKQIKNINKNLIVYLSDIKIILLSILEWFLKDHVTLKTGVMTLKIQLWSQE